MRYDRSLFHLVHGQERIPAKQGRERCVEPAPKWPTGPLVSGTIWTVNATHRDLHSYGVAAAAGRFAPSPTGELHLGNLRTALVAWLSARSQHLAFVVRMEDLDRVSSSAAHETVQLEALRALGLDWDGPVLRQSERFHLYDRAIAELTEAGRTYECYCTRREIREAASAPQSSSYRSGAQVAESAYNGACRQLTHAQRSRLISSGPKAALRLDAKSQSVTIRDELRGSVTTEVDDVVLRRNDGVPAYNLAVVIDDALQGVVEVVRGDDLLSSTPRQVLLQQLLSFPTPRYRHIPLAVNSHGQRLAKRDGAVTMSQLAAKGVGPRAVLAICASSLGLSVPGETITMAAMVDRFDFQRIPDDPWVVSEHLQRSMVDENQEDEHGR